MQVLLSLLAQFQQWWACRRKASMIHFNIHHHGLVSYCDRWDDYISHHSISPTNDDQNTLPNEHLIKGRQKPCHIAALDLQPKGRVSYCLPRISEKRKHTYTTSSRCKLQYGAGLIHTAPPHNRVPWIVGHISGRLIFRRTNLCDQPRLCKGIIHSNLLGTKWMGESEYYNKEL
jgi:hypothetical protein